MKTIFVDAVYCFSSDTGEIERGVYDLLETFPNKKVIVTGADDEQLKKFGLDRMPYEVFTLKHTPEKTDPKYFEIMLMHFGLKKEDVIYFEYNPEAVASAESLGITAYHYDSEKKDLESLKNFLIENI